MWKGISLFQSPCVYNLPAKTFEWSKILDEEVPILYEHRKLFRLRLSELEYEYMAAGDTRTKASSFVKFFFLFGTVSALLFYL